MFASLRQASGIKHPKKQAIQGSAIRSIRKISSLKSADFPNAFGALPIRCRGHI